MSSTKKVAQKTAKKTTKTAVPKKAAKKSVKKTVKKTVKKAAPKKKATAKKETAKEPKLVQAKGAQCFWVHDGPILKNLLELEAALDAMAEEVFAHHVSKDRHDFAEWVEHVLKDADTATALRKAKKPHTARKVVVRQLKLYKLPE